MPESINDAFKLADIARSLVVGAVGSGAAMVAFFNRYQTKGGCKKAHSNHDKLDIERQKVRDEKLGRIHDSVERTEKLVLKMANDFYKPKS